MWDHIPLDLLTHIFSFLPPDSLARAKSTCNHWHHCPNLPPSRHPPWLLAFPSRARPSSCYAHNPALNHWHTLPLDFLPSPVCLVSPVASLLLCKLAASPTLRLLLCNPFTRHHHPLPDLTTPRSNPAVAVVVSGDDPSPSFCVYVAGGAAGASYEPTVEVYDSRVGGWRVAGAMPAEFAVRLTVWTPNESVHADGVVYWMTSARAYSVYLFWDLGSEMLVWREVNEKKKKKRWEWSLVDGCCSPSVTGISMKAALIHPTLSHSCMLCIGNNCDVVKGH